jgi:tungstate transport system substrate-binding protein
MKKAIGIALALCLVVGALLPAQSGRLRLATTTSTENSGLLAVLLPPFEAKTDLKVDVIAVGTGQALRLGRAGDVDIVLVHARQLEDEFVADGYGVNRRDVMHNDFIVIGPASDPAGIGGMGDCAAALKRIADRGETFVSRGDNSGTHVKEQSLWRAAGPNPTGRWYREAGQGMGPVITMAGDMQGYTLADRGTYLSMKDKIQLRVLVEGDPRLFNPYGIIAVNPDRFPHVAYFEAMQLIAWMTSVEGQEIIGNYKVQGDALFYPDTVTE